MVPYLSAHGSAKATDESENSEARSQEPEDFGYRFALTNMAKLIEPKVNTFF
jgi:hypothetical protein